MNNDSVVSSIFD